MLDKIKNNYFLLIFFFLLVYFLYNSFGGQRGLISNNLKKNELDSLKNDKTVLVKEINDLKLKNSLLKDNLDLDYIEILIRDKFIFGKKGEINYIIKNNEN